MATVKLQHAIQTRPVQPADHPYLFDLYASTRQDIWAMADWSDVRKLDFIRSQFTAQTVDYKRRFPRGSFDVILHQGEPAGRLSVDRGDAEIRVIDIIVAPAYRQRGIARHLMRGLLAEAAQRRVPVRLYAAPNSPAMDWYQRLGFRQIGQSEFAYHMQWNPAGAVAPALRT